MATYSDMDSDASRLPDGFVRAGYDADTETYTYSSRDGQHYSGLPGNRHGWLYPTGSDAHQQALQHGDPYAIEMNKLGWWQREEWRRYLAPFLVLVGVYLLLMIWWLGYFGNRTSAIKCAENEIRHEIKPGDTCWAIGQKYNVEPGLLKGGYSGHQADRRLDLVCEKLVVGDVICIPSTVR